MKSVKAAVLMVAMCLSTLAYGQNSLLLWPMSEGRVWTYQCQDAANNTWTETREVLGSTMMGGIKYYQVRFTEGMPGESYNFTIYIRSTDYALFISDGQGGEMMDFVIGPEGFTLIPEENRTRQIVAVESITVPYGGPYQAYSYGKSALDEPELPSPFMIESYAPGLGLIKVVDYWVDNPPVIKQLVSIQPWRLCGDYDYPYPEGDLDNDCRVNLTDLAILAANWLTCTAPECVESSEPDITWVYINDDGSGMKDGNGTPISQGGFTGEMSKYETTNAQYAQYLNAALAANQIFVHTDNVVYADGDTSFSEPYFSTSAADSWSQITYSGGAFTVRTRDGHSMADHPVVMVSWYGATAFADYYGWRLPTEWEWQAVADYDGSYIYGCGTTIDLSKANYGSANPLNLTSMPYTSPVGHYPASDYGMADMAGNVWEWTSSLWDPAYSYRVLRGGSWRLYAYHFCSVSYRGSYNPYGMHYYYGFRVCR